MRVRVCGIIGVALLLWTSTAAAQDWSDAERAVIASLRLNQQPPAVPDPSNVVAANPAAVALGRQLFFDPRFSRNGALSCATCHDPGKQFQDGVPRAKGLATVERRTMPLAGVAFNAWQFWDGRKDSLWAQAMDPIEDAREMGGNRTRAVQLLAAHYRRPYEALFGPLPDGARLPANAGPLGSPDEIAAWNRMDAATQAAVTRAFVNMAKAIAAFEATLRHSESRFDRYAEALVKKRPPAADGMLTANEQRGLRLFIGKALCVSCHGGPLFTDHFFHSTRVPALDAAKPDPGRAQGALQVKDDPFNCVGAYSDAKREDCREIRFIVVHDPVLRRAFKTPSLRGVAERPPYMHAGQLATLFDVIRHYAKAPESVVVPRTAGGHGHGGGSELTPLALSEQDIADLVAFLGTLSAPVVEIAPPG